MPASRAFVYPRGRSRAHAHEPGFAAAVADLRGADTCVERPTRALTVSVVTTGDEPDPDGYTVTVGGRNQAVAVDGAVTFENLAAGEHEVALEGRAANCSAEGANPRTVAVDAGATRTTTFDVSCPLTQVQVTVATTGALPDPDGYNVILGGAGKDVDANGSTTFTVDASGGTWPLELADVAYNCMVAGDNPREVEVAAGTTAEVDFALTCPEPIVLIDGERGPGEWDGATTQALFAGATMFAKTDGENLYLGFEVEDDTFTDGDIVRVRFDNDRDGVLDDGEDLLAVALGGFTDAHASGGNWGITDHRWHGEGAAAGANGVSWFELAHPLDSGDPQDFSLAPGETVGYCVIYWDDLSGTSATTHPGGCQLDGEDLSGYAVLTVPQPVQGRE